MHFTDTPIPVPLGVYDGPAVTFGTKSVPLETTGAGKLLRDMTTLARRLEELAPGAGGLMKVLTPG